MDRQHLAGDLGIQTADGFHRLLRRGDRLPARAKVTLRTAEDDQDHLEFTLLQRLGPTWSAAFRQARIDHLPPRPRGKVKIHLEILVEEDGTLVARVRAPGRKGATEMARGRAAIATREGLDRAARAGDGVGLVERGILAPGTVSTPEAPLRHECSGCGAAIVLRAISLLDPAREGLTCEACGNLLLIPALDNMAASFYRDVPEGRLALATPPATVTPAREAAHGEAIARLESALEACPCGGRFRVLSTASCPSCGEAFVDDADDVVFRARQTHLPLLEGSRIVERPGPSLWNEAHRRRFEVDVDAGPLERRGRRYLLPLRFRNRDGWLIVPLGYALVLRGADGSERRAFRPADFSTGTPSASPEAWQARQSEEDAAFAEEIERECGFRPLLEAVEADGEVEGTAVFPTGEDLPRPATLVVGRGLAIPLG